MWDNVVWYGTQYNECVVCVVRKNRRISSYIERDLDAPGPRGDYWVLDSTKRLVGKKRRCRRGNNDSNK